MINLSRIFLRLLIWQTFFLQNLQHKAIVRMHKIKSTEKPTATQTVFALIQPTIVSKDKATLWGSELTAAYFVPY